jgi:diguanylate cyclase (GGDEF)-like protein
MNATIELDVFSLVLLGFAVVLASRNYMASSRNRWYIYSALCLMLVILSELFAYFVDEVGASHQIPYHRVANILGFSLSPVVCYFLLKFIIHAQHQRMHPVLFLPMVISACMSVLSYYTGWYFFVDEQNIYRRGPLFPLATSVMLFYYALCIYYLLKTLQRYEASDRPLLYCIFATPILGFIVQMVFPAVLTLWPSITLSLFLFYLFFLEQRYSIDTLTLLRNRSIFMRDLLDIQSAREASASIVVLDLNNLKKTNDTYGHKRGDELLIEAGNLIERSFRGVGTVYRVGGDEFAVISTIEDSEAVQRALILLQSHLALANSKREIPLSIAYGVARCESCIDNLFNTYIAADNAMYRNKMIQQRRPSYG